MGNFISNRVATTNTNSGSQHVATVDTRYVKLDEDTHGWLRVKIEDGTGQSAFLCEYTKITMIALQGDRCFFKISDGWSDFVGHTASMSKENSDRYLKKLAPVISSEKLKVKYGKMAEEYSEFKGRLKQQWGSLSVNGKNILVTLNSVWGSVFSPIPQGIHRIMAPDTSHAQISTEGYRNKYPGGIKGNDVWFPIELAGKPGNSSRYIHIGHLSEGCVTVHEIEQWNVVYNFLISHRLPNTNGKYVAFLEVEK